MKRVVRLSPEDCLKLPGEWRLKKEAVKEKFGDCLFSSFSGGEIEVVCPGPNCGKKMEGDIQREDREIRYKCSSSICPISVLGKY